ncbi:MAG: tetratricopeptide repeat protein [Bdellovibrionales bacterium]
MNSIVSDIRQNDPALERLVASANASDPDALFAGSYVLAGGFNLTPINPFAEAEWAKRGMTLNHGPSSVKYGLMVELGLTDFELRNSAQFFVIKGKQWLLDASTSGDMYALSLLALAEREGLGVRKSQVNYAKHLKEAADLGEPFSMKTLSDHYTLGRASFPKDHGAALSYSQSAAVEGLASAQYQLGNYYYEGVHIASDKDKALEFFTLAARQGHDRSQLALGEWYSDRQPCSAANLTESVRWWSLAAQNGLCLPEFRLAQMHETGSGGIEKNIAEAYRMYHALLTRDGKSLLTRQPERNLKQTIALKLLELERIATSSEITRGTKILAWGEDEIVVPMLPVHTTIGPSSRLKLRR